MGEGGRLTMFNDVQHCLTQKISCVFFGRVIDFVQMKNVTTNGNPTEYAGWPSESAEHGLTHNDVEWDMPHDVGDAPATPDDDASATPDDDAPATPDDDAPATPDDYAPADDYSGYGSGEDDLADYNQNEANDYLNE